MQLVYVENIECGYVAYYTKLDHNGDTCVQVYYSAGSIVHELDSAESAKLLAALPDDID